MNALFQNPFKFQFVLLFHFGFVDNFLPLVLQSFVGLVDFAQLVEVLLQLPQDLLEVVEEFGGKESEEEIPSLVAIVEGLLHHTPGLLSQRVHEGDFLFFSLVLVFLCVVELTDLSILKSHLVHFGNGLGSVGMVSDQRNEILNIEVL